MRLIKMFGLAVIAASAMMAFVGASSAMATSTVLCQVNQLVCPSDKKIENTLIKGLASNSPHKLLLGTSLVDVECSHSVIEIDVLALANPLVGHVSELSFTGCKREDNGNPCTTSFVLKGLLKLLKTAPNLGSLTTEGNAVLVKCGSFLHCVYSGTPALHAVGGTPAHVTANAAKLTEKEGFFCPDTSTWLALYELTSPTTAFIAE